jgi:autotransporter passenger strand-loop-strand repeat protein
VVDPGAVFIGKVSASTSASAVLELATGSSGGTLSGLGTNFTGFGTVTVDGGAAWELIGTNTLAAGATLVNSGTLTLSSTTFTDSGGLVNNGALVLDPSTLTVANISGSGTVTISSGSILDVLGGTANNVTVSNGGTLTISSGGPASAVTIAAGGTVEVFNGGSLIGSIVDNGTVDFDITSGIGFSGTVTGDGLLVVSGGGGLNVTLPYTGSVQVEDASTLEFDNTYVGVSTFSGAPTGSGGTLKFDGNSIGPITVANSNDTVIAQPGSNNWINAAVSYTLPANIDALFLFAGAHGTGNSDAAGDALYALDAGNAQTLTGNSPNDAFVVYNSSDVLVPKAGSHDVVYAAASYTVPTGIDVLILEAGTQAVGNSDAAGDALYAASPGQVATLTGNSPNDTFVVYNSSDVVVPKAGSHDLVYAAVNYTLPTGVDSLILEIGTQATGNSDAAGDALYAANAGVAQTLTGNSHNDSFVVYNSGDTVVGKAGSTDTVYAAANFTLPTNVDTLFLEGNASHGTGNGDAVDLLVGNAGVASTLVAGSGADLLVVAGTAGTIMTGGAGSDTFAFPDVMGQDEVTNFDFTKDTLQFNATLFSNFSAAMNAAGQVGANTVFTIDTNDTVTLDNVTKTSLTAANFHFV